jgi:hypothetical protein
MTFTLSEPARIIGNYEKKSICLLRLSKICLTSTGNWLRISLLTQMKKVARGGIFGSLESMPRKSQVAGDREGLLEKQLTICKFFVCKTCYANSVPQLTYLVLTSVVKA